ncbi:VOC family protein [bacterium]|nr:VOC family protein [bacterium]
MPDKVAQPAQRIIPYLLYEDAEAAIEFLTTAFGFEEKMRYPMDNGIGHASPKERGGTRHGLVCVYVDDVDALFENAKAAGATVVREPADQFYGDRNCVLDDPEGQQWSFHQRIKVMTDEELMAATPKG